VGDDFLRKDLLEQCLNALENGRGTRERGIKRQDLDHLFTTTIIVVKLS
jgi:hypothetical protein